MISVISPAKSLNFKINTSINTETIPKYTAESNELITLCKKLSITDIQRIMNISDKLSELNYKRFQEFESQTQKQAIFAYDGDVYDNINKHDFTSKQLDFLQNHILIISGLYGLLRPLDTIRPYRLEMSTKLPDSRDLYHYWESIITNYLNLLLEKHTTKYLINLASIEYSAVINKKILKYPIITIHFKENKYGKLKTVGINAKKARGMMIDYIVKHKIDDPKALKEFNYAGYEYNKNTSTESDLLFTTKVFS